MSLDQLDLHILELLRADGRIPIKRLAAQVHVSRASAYSRLKRLQDTGVIQGFTAVVDPAQVGFKVSAVLLLTTVQPPAEPGSLDLLEGIPGVEFAAWVTGEVDLVLIVRARDVSELRDSIVWRLRRNPAVRATQTLLVFQEAIRESYLLPGAGVARDTSADGRDEEI